MRISALLGSLAVLVLLPVLRAEEQSTICRYCGRDHGLAMQLEPEGNDAASGRRYAPDRVVDMLHLRVDVTPDFEAGTVAATTSLTFTPIAKPTSSITLNAIRLDVSKIDATVKLADTVVTDESITIHFAEPLPVGQQATVDITYTCQPKKGLYFRTPKLGYAKGDTHIWTQGETHEARHWIPCFDFPNERSSTEIICHVPQDMQVFSNGKQVGDDPDPATGLKAVHWLQQKPHVTYLICLVAGYFETLEDQHNETPLHFHTQPSLAAHAKNSFADTRQIMAFYEEEIGVPFPWDKYDQVTILDFTSGGMENTSLTTLTHTTVFPDEWQNIKSSRELDAHEMAHQWFGDLVTCEDWSHLWLNEGFATYYTHLYNEHKLGRDEYLYGLWQDANNEIFAQGDDTKPIVWREYATAWQQFDYRAYPKGSWVLHMLRSQLGKDIYRAAIKNYLSEHQLTSAVTEDLVDALESASGKELDQFFDQWVYHGGQPALRVRYEWLGDDKLAKVSVTQTQETGDKVLLFAFPTKLRFWVDGKPVDHAIEITDKQHDFYVPLNQQPTSVRFDPEFSVLAKVDFEPPTALLMEQLTRADDVIGRLYAVQILAQRDDAKSLAALGERLTSDPFYGVRLGAAKAIARRETSEALKVLIDSRKQDDARVRLAVIEGISGYYRPAALRVLLATIDSEPNPLIVAAALRGLGKFDADASREAIEKSLHHASFGNRIAVAAILAAGDTADPDYRGRVLRTVSRSLRDYADRDASAVLGVIAKLWQDADDKSPARELLEKCLTDPSRRLNVAAIEALGTLGDPRSRAALESFADGEAQGREARAAREAIDQLTRTPALAPRELGELRQLVDELQREQTKLREQMDELKEKSTAKEK